MLGWLTGFGLHAQQLCQVMVMVMLWLWLCARPGDGHMLVLHGWCCMPGAAWLEDMLAGWLDDMLTGWLLSLMDGMHAGCMACLMMQCMLHVVYMLFAACCLVDAMLLVVNILTCHGFCMLHTCLPAGTDWCSLVMCRACFCYQGPHLAHTSSTSNTSNTSSTSKGIKGCYPRSQPLS
jgi:hypothetical protein